LKSFSGSKISQTVEKAKYRDKDIIIDTQQSKHGNKADRITQIKMKIDEFSKTIKKTEDKIARD